ncbi:MAG: M48 family metallopeptidase [Natronohydrobacter sp.]|nr:M48 family metallopeptidase [Natronohydrobacter sp.]
MGIQVRDGTAHLTTTPAISVSLRRSAQARRLNLRVSGLDGRVTLTMPRSLPLAEALAFLREKESWLRAAMGRVPGRQPVRPGHDILLRGQIVRITETPATRRILETPGALLVPPDPEGQRTPVRLAAWLKTTAQSELLPAVDHYARALGRPFSALSLRDTRSRWGSCTADGRLMFSWRLIMAPPQVLHYVAAHEVAHLRHMDHSRAFWACVRELMPDYALHRTWLREHGAALHGYCFNARPAAENG